MTDSVVRVFDKRDCECFIHSKTLLQYIESVLDLKLVVKIKNNSSARFEQRAV